MAGPKIQNFNCDEDLANLDEWIRRLKVEYEIFFNGHRKKPPEDLKGRVERLLKRLSEIQNLTVPQRFRYNTLVTRFYVYRDLWRRTLQLRESGEQLEKGLQTPHTPVPPPALHIRVSIGDPKTDDHKVRELYNSLLHLKGKNGQSSPNISYTQFAEYITKQTQIIRSKYGCSSVLFTIAMDQNAIRFTATSEISNTTRPRDRARNLSEN